MSSELEPGALLADRFRLERKLGSGGMGVVWLAQHTKTKKRVALKLIKPGAAPEQGKRLHREARAASVIRHPNVREVFDVMADADGSPIIVMEFLEGRPLSAVLAQETKLSLERTADILVPVVSAIGTAHALGIVHRDLKPDNVFLVEHPAPTVKVVDFGIAKLTATEGDAAETAGLTGTGSIVGTPHFMAPEQVFGERQIDYRADIWALGLVAYQMLSGVLPTQAENVGQVMKIIVSRGIPPLHTVAPEVPDEVARRIDQMLARDPKKRLSDLRELLEVLLPYTKAEAPPFDGPVGFASEPADLEGTPTEDARTASFAPAGRPRSDDAEPPTRRTSRRWLVLGAAILATTGAAMALSAAQPPNAGSASSASAPAMALDRPSSLASTVPAKTTTSSSASAMAARPASSAEAGAPPPVKDRSAGHATARLSSPTTVVTAVPPEVVPTVQVQTAW